MSWLKKALEAREARDLAPVPKPSKPCSKAEKRGFDRFCSFGTGHPYSETCLIELEERVAILIEAGGQPPDIAHRLATNELGGEQLVQWRYHIEQLPAANTLESSQFIKTATAFLDTPMAAMAAYYGWDDWQVFGVFNGPPRAMVRRHDAMGLVLALAWSQIGSKLVDMDSDRAIIETYTSNTLTHKQSLVGRRYAVPVWWSEIMKDKQNDR